MDNTTYETVADYWNANTAPPVVIVERHSDGELLGQVSVFVSAILLSMGGCIAVVCSHMRKSNCSYISCFGTKCTRENLGVDDPV